MREIQIRFLHISRFTARSRRSIPARKAYITSELGYGILDYEILIIRCK